jgi:hypothetical protein
MLRPALEKLLPVMAISCWGFCPEDLEIVFDPANPASLEERTAQFEKITATVVSAYQANLITRGEAIQELKSQGLPISAWSRLPDEDDPYANQFAGEIGKS